MGKLKLGTIASVGILGMLVFASYAQAGGTQTPAACQVSTNNALGGANILGTVALTAYNVAGSQGNLDAIFRLRYGSKEGIFRVHLDGAALVSPEDVLCQLLAATPRNSSGETILAGLKINAGVIKINNKAFTGISFDNIPGTGELPDGFHKAGISEITMYAQ